MEASYIGVCRQNVNGKLIFARKMKTLYFNLKKSWLKMILRSEYPNWRLLKKTLKRQILRLSDDAW